MAVLHGRIRDHRAILSTRDDHRNFKREIDKALDDGIDARQSTSRHRPEPCLGQLDLAFAVIAHARRLS